MQKMDKFAVMDMDVDSLQGSRIRRYWELYWLKISKLSWKKSVRPSIVGLGMDNKETQSFYNPWFRRPP